MKKYLLLALITLLVISCNSKRNIDKEIKEKITEFYTFTEVKDYQPISYSDFDTIHRLSSGTITTGIIKHTLRARSNNGNINEFSHTFEVTVFDDLITVIPKGFK
ncbi:hypothetical protein LNI94_00475 [Tenacibaculum finnmarkense genomovar ulcerans]|uniref:hypothetical protein n=1 Tax=Tenacibaculum finnmarkense TaxID=2781243 RepID=UPI001E635647|nr:hypothetical protein [Tenacibaculum finnmarkense]MCD8421365.1 hypothetical protein [Tenacibaculum finnmarkense genomovar ulcerans]